MKIKKIKLFVFFSSVLLCGGCSIHGYYTSNPKSKLALAGYEIILTPNNTFHIKSWTDNFTNHVDSLGNRIWTDNWHRGFGTFIQSGDSLEMTFLNEDSITIDITRSSENFQDNYKVSFISESGNLSAPIVSLKDSTLRTIKNVINKDETYTEFSMSSDSTYRAIGFDLHWYRAPEILIPFEDIEQGKTQFKFKTYNGYYPKGTRINFYCKKAWSGIRYGDKRRWLAKKYKANWLNTFYDR